LETLRIKLGLDPDY